MKAIVVGSGGTARELVRRLGETWRITVVDLSTDRLEQMSTLRDVATVRGDGSSRVVLERAGLAEADAVVAATDDDEVNLEVCRLARDAGIERLVALIADLRRAEDYRTRGITAESPASLAARRIELELETRRMSSMAFAHGRAEAIEFRIAEDSPVCGKALRELKARSWIVGALLRDDRLVIPHGDTRLQAGDLVTVVGAGADFAEIVRTFTSGEARFPLAHGKRIAVAIDAQADLDGPLAEAIYLVRNTKASSLVLVHQDPDALSDETAAAGLRKLLSRAAAMADGVEIRMRPVAGSPDRALGEIAAKESIGLLVLDAPPARSMATAGRVRHALALLKTTRRPVLLARGRYPYRTLLAPARRTEAGRAAARAALDLSLLLQAELQALAVADPYFLAGPDAPREPREAIAWLEEDGSVLGVELRGLVRQGNPGRLFVELGDDANCVVLAVDPAARRHPAWRARVSGFVARRTRSSVMLIPVRAPS